MTATRSVSEKCPIKVAIVGSGLAGLTTAYLLHQDPKGRFAVTVIEEGKELALDAASISIKDTISNGPERIDLPMRAFAGGYYQTLRKLYDHLNIKYETQPFLFSFSKVGPRLFRRPEDQKAAYFIHSSNNHRTPPVKPRDLPLHLYALEIAYLIVLYSYFALCCFLLRPHAARNGKPSESLERYFRRIWIPRYFETHYILPLISGVATCSHTELLQFPASDVTEYKRKTSGEKHYAVSDGVGSVQKKLVQGIQTEFSAHVTSVEAQENGKVRVQWRHPGDSHVLAPSTEYFDYVVIAVPPNVVGKIFRPLHDVMARIPTVKVETVVHTDSSTIRETLGSLGEHTGRMQSLILHTSDSRTEAINVQTSGILVTTNPFTPINTDKVIHTSNFTRVLRTVESQGIVNDIIGEGEERHRDDLPTEKPSKWHNGEGGVFLCGGWMWDGLVLLEGCAVSAVKVASALGVEVPWSNSN